MQMEVEVLEEEVEEEGEEDAEGQMEVEVLDEECQEEDSPLGGILWLSAAKSCSACIVVANSSLASATTGRCDGDNSSCSFTQNKRLRWRCDGDAMEMRW